MDDTAASPRLMLPAQPALVAGVRRAAWLTADGEIETPPLAEAAKCLTSGPGPAVRPVVCDAKTTAKRLGIGTFAAFDVLELYAFVRPARFVLPTPRGVAQALGLKLPATLPPMRISPCSAPKSRSSTGCSLTMNSIGAHSSRGPAATGTARGWYLDDWRFLAISVD